MKTDDIVDVLESLVMRFWGGECRYVQSCGYNIRLNIFVYLDK